MERKLASVRVISELCPIPDADLIETAVVDGWTVVVKRGEFNVGDRAVYLEIDSWVPTELAPFLSKGKEPREFNEVKGERLRTVKLKKQLSQGLLLPMSCLTNYGADLVDGSDVTECLRIQKWEAPLPTQMQGKALSTFPSEFIKSDQERAQNLIRDIFTKNINTSYEVTLKLDGSSCSIYQRADGTVGVCSRNFELKINDENSENAFIKTTKRTGLFDVLSRPEYAGLMIQAELMGPGVQGNRENLPEFSLYVFDIQRIGHVKLSPTERMQVFNSLVSNGALIAHCPIVYESTTLSALGIRNINTMKAWSDKPSMVNKIAEGFVFKSLDSPFTFKIINDKFLLKEEC